MSSPPPMASAPDMDSPVHFHPLMLIRAGVLLSVSAASMYWSRKYDSRRARSLAAVSGLAAAFHAYHILTPALPFSFPMSLANRFTITDLNQVYQGDLQKLQKMASSKWHLPGQKGHTAALPEKPDQTAAPALKEENTAPAPQPKLESPAELQVVLAKQQLGGESHSLGSPSSSAVSYVVDYDPYSLATPSSVRRRNHAVEFADTVQFLMKQAQVGDEVIVRLTSPGGTTFEYGYLAHLLQRLRAMGVTVTVTVDMMAASGGYLMACTANTIVAAPWAVIGSIGVVTEMPNFHRTLKRYDVDWQEVTAGKYKRSLTPFGEVTQEGRDHVQGKINGVYEKFMAYIQENRGHCLTKPIAEIATGETWNADDAKELGLIDVLATSNALLHHRTQQRHVYHIAAHPQPFGGILSGLMGSLNNFCQVRGLLSYEEAMHPFMWPPAQSAWPRGMPMMMWDPTEHPRWQQ